MVSFLFGETENPMVASFLRTPWVFPFQHMRFILQLAVPVGRTFWLFARRSICTGKGGHIKFRVPKSQSDGGK